MSVRIALTSPPEFYTNLDSISGKIILGINRPEQVAAVIVKLEGESKTALAPPRIVNDGYPQANGRRRSSAADPAHTQVVQENHKVLYKVQQIFPDESIPAYSVPVMFEPGSHEWKFDFRLPFNNACGDPNAMAKIGGLAGAGGFTGPSLFGMGGIRLMDGSKQLFYKHVTKTLPPSFTGFPRQAEIRYYIKVTIQRPGLFKENWRHQLGFKFMPIEPPRPRPTYQEAYARRPFTFRPKSPGLGTPSPSKNAKRVSVFGRKASSSLLANGTVPTDQEQPPAVEISARLPHPPILTCNQPIPLRLIAKKIADTRAECYLVSLQIDLVGSTMVRCQDLVNMEPSRWVVVSRSGLAIPLQNGPNALVGVETEINSVLWINKPLPNTVMPSFVTCNLKRSYALELKIGVSWGKPPDAITTIPDESPSVSSKASVLSLRKSKGKDPMPNLAQTIFLPLHFSAVQVFSGLTPPEGLAQATLKARKQQTSAQQPQRPSSRPNGNSSQSAPDLPPRQQQHQQQQQQQHDPLYPPQLRPGQSPVQASTAAAASGSHTGGANELEDLGAAPPYGDAPPSYDDAIAEIIPGPVVSAQARPAYSGVTNENAPDSLPGKS